MHTPPIEFVTLRPYYYSSEVVEILNDLPTTTSGQEEDIHALLVGPTPGVYVVSYGPASEWSRHNLGSWKTRRDAKAALDHALPRINPHNAKLHRHGV